MKEKDEKDDFHGAGSSRPNPQERQGGEGAG